MLSCTSTSATAHHSNQKERKLNLRSERSGSGTSTLDSYIVYSELLCIKDARDTWAVRAVRGVRGGFASRIKLNLVTAHSDWKTQYSH